MFFIFYFFCCCCFCQFCFLNLIEYTPAQRCVFHSLEEPSVGVYIGTFRNWHMCFSSWWIAVVFCCSIFPASVVSLEWKCLFFLHFPSYYINVVATPFDECRNQSPYSAAFQDKWPLWKKFLSLYCLLIYLKRWMWNGEAYSAAYVS